VLATAPDITRTLVNQPVEPLMAKELIGSLAPATSELLSQVGAPYQPGDTVGSSGLELLFQRRLAGVPTVKVLVLDSAGQPKGKPLAENPGNECKPTGDAPSGTTETTGEDPDARESKSVTTTIDPKFQARAERTLKLFGKPGSIVTVLGETGGVVAAANNMTGGKNTAFEGELTPGMAFSPIFATGLLSSDVSVTDKAECPASTIVGGQTFTSKAAQNSSLGLNLVRNCTSAFARLGSTMPATDFAAAMKRFGLDLQWDMSQVPHFQATGITPVTEVDRANAAIGQGGVKVSPLTMALAASAIENGTWHEPAVILSPDPAGANARYLGPTAVTSLQAMMKMGARFNFPSKPRRYDGALIAKAKDEKGNLISWFIGYKNDNAVAIAIQGDVDMALVADEFLNAAQVPTANATGPANTQVS
jgi:cell division protein FtsI/penicillin-binding protein 2